MRGAKLAILIGVPLVSLVFAAAAAASCNPQRGPDSSQSWWDGWFSNQPSSVCITGSSANITVYSPYTYSDETSTAWVMLENPLTLKYGQIGWLKESGALHNFYQSWTVGDGRQGQYLGTPSVGTAPEYKITFSSDAFHYFLDGVNWYTDANTGFAGCYSDQYGEVTNYANQMPGARDNHVKFTNSEMRRSDTGWVDMNGVSDDTWSPSDYGIAKASSTRLDIWDKACTS